MLAKNMKEFHRIVCERDDYTCCVCKKSYNYPAYFNDKGVNQFVCGHHLKSKGSHKELELETDNGVCIDYHCHEKLHRGLVKL